MWRLQYHTTQVTSQRFTAGFCPRKILARDAQSHNCGTREENAPGRRVEESFLPWRLQALNLSPPRLTWPPRFLLQTWDIRARRYTSSSYHWETPLISPISFPRKLPAHVSTQTLPLFRVHRETQTPRRPREKQRPRQRLERRNTAQRRSRSPDGQQKHSRSRSPQKSSPRRWPREQRPEERWGRQEKRKRSHTSEDKKRQNSSKSFTYT